MVHKNRHFLPHLGLQRSSKDPNLYFFVKNDLYTILLLYVDDIILTGDDDATISHIKRTMMDSFKMTDLGDARYYLGIELDYTEDGIYFHQKGYIEKLLDRFGMINCTSRHKNFSKPSRRPITRHHNPVGHSIRSRLRISIFNQPATRTFAYCKEHSTLYGKNLKLHNSIPYNRFKKFDYLL
jgi:hypothetical protein